MLMVEILDFGCGDGFRAEVLGRRGRYWGVDVLPDNIRQAKEKYPSHLFKLIDGVKLPFPDGYFDEIYAYDVLEHVDNLETVLEEIMRCLKNSGKFVVEVPAQISEEYLLKIAPDYWKEVGHVRIIDDNVINAVITKYDLKILKKQRKKGIDNILLVYYLKTGKHIIGQTGKFMAENMFMRRLAYLFSEDFFQTKLFRSLILLWVLFPVWLLTQPIGKVLSAIFPKSIHYEFCRNN
jgi:ubiquinone/menaquinone biosynthesis C-methylase UbiE